MVVHAGDLTKVFIPEDGRTKIRHLDLVYKFPGYPTRASWESRAEHIRKRILVSTGLMPMPEKKPLNAKTTGKIEHDDYSIENVYFESFPGFFVTGNLYIPKGKQGPFPGIANPHGHWANGRLAHEEAGSIPARCISFARQGYVAFAYDMIGYNDSKLQVSHGFGSDPKGYLWGISLMGLQLWNSIRVVDFLQSLPYVDPDRIACTGASGGGTQTFMLMSIDKRVKVSAPVNMISSHMQGGCLCENAPSLRLDCYNVEIGAMMAPRPMIMISATGDWTKNTPDLEFPAIQSIYRLYGAADMVTNTHIDAGHNYNKDSREAVYEWFGKIFGADKESLKEQPFELDPPEKMLVFPDGKLPDNAVSDEQLVSNLIEESRSQIKSLKPVDSASLEAYSGVMGTAYQYALSVRQPEACDMSIQKVNEEQRDGYKIERAIISQKHVGEQIPSVLFVPDKPSGAVLIFYPEGKSALAKGNEPNSLVKGFIAKNKIVMGIDAFKTGELALLKKEGVNHFYTYNLSDTALQIQDILTAITYLQTLTYTVNLVGMEEAGLWCLLARGLAHNVNQTIVDADQFEYDDDDLWVKRLFIPHIRRAGDFMTAAALIAPAKLIIHNTSDSFPEGWIRDIYSVSGALESLRIQRDKANDEFILINN